MFSRITGGNGAYVLLDTTAGGHTFPLKQLLVGAALLVLGLAYPIPETMGLAFIGSALLLLVALIWLSPHRFHALGPDGLHEYVKHLGKARFGRHLARREDILGVAVVPDSSRGGPAAWAAAVHVRGQRLIKLDNHSKKSDADAAAFQAASELGLPLLEESPTPEHATVVQPGNLVAVQLDSDTETWLTWGAFGFLLLAFIPGCIWMVMQAGLGDSSAIFGKIALGLLGPSLLLFLIRGQLEDFIVLDLGTRRLISIRRFAGSERQTVLASLDDVRDAAVVIRVEHGRRGSKSYSYRPVLRLKNGRFHFVGELTNDGCRAHGRAEDLARKIGCEFSPDAQGLPALTGCHPIYVVLMGFAVMYFVWIFWGMRL